MIDAFNALLEARDPERGCFRSYRLEAGTDLFGTWLVEITFGRIGATGTRIRHAVTDELSAKKLVHSNLRRRASAPKRIGTSYQMRELRDPTRWLDAFAEIPPPSRHGSCLQIGNPRS
jgi:hypothetical protein